MDHRRSGGIEIEHVEQAVAHGRRIGGLVLLRRVCGCNALGPGGEGGGRLGAGPVGIRSSSARSPAATCLQLKPAGQSHTPSTDRSAPSGPVPILMLARYGHLLAPEHPRDDASVHLPVERADPTLAGIGGTARGRGLTSRDAEARQRWSSWKSCGRTVARPNARLAPVKSRTGTSTVEAGRHHARNSRLGSDPQRRAPSPAAARLGDSAQRFLGRALLQEFDRGMLIWAIRRPSTRGRRWHTPLSPMSSMATSVTPPSCAKSPPCPRRWCLPDKRGPGNRNVRSIRPASHLRKFTRTFPSRSLKTDLFGGGQAGPRPQSNRER